MTRRTRPSLLPLAALAATLVLASCGAGEQAGADAAPAALSDALETKLASADALDGSADHVVTRCSGCRLGMNGKAEHPLHVGDYTLHMCSESCKAAFSSDLDANLAKLEIPQS